MLHLSKVGFYGLNAIMFVAKHKKEVLKIRDIAEGIDMSESLLRRIVADLERAGILKTIRGRNGGVILARDGGKISIYDILTGVHEELGIRDCTKGLSCKNQGECQTTEILASLQKGFNSLLKMYTLDKLIK